MVFKKKYIEIYFIFYNKEVEVSSNSSKIGTAIDKIENRHGKKMTELSENSQDFFLMNQQT